jgi:ubiquinone/menaquinone biosynthesis C-methylase UbiE
MNSDAANFVGSVPEHYEHSLGPIIFADFAVDLALRAAACSPARVLETAAGTGIVTRQLRNFLPASVHLVATDLNPPMLEMARMKVRPIEQVEFRPADGTALPFADGSFDAVVCQFGVMFFPEKDKSYREVYRVLAPGGRYLFNVWDSHRHNPFGRNRACRRWRILPCRSPSVLQCAVRLSPNRSDQGILDRRRIH